MDYKFLFFVGLGIVLCSVFLLMMTSIQPAMGILGNYASLVIQSLMIFGGFIILYASYRLRKGRKEHEI